MSGIRSDGFPARVAIGLLLAIGLGGAALALLGGQISGVLSTVGASVGGSLGDGQPVAEPPLDEAGPGQGDGVPAARAGLPVNSIDRPDLLIIKTGSITIQVGLLDAAIRRTDDAIAALGGYAAASSRSGDGDEASATITYRVPVAAWEAAQAAVRGVAEKILDERSGTEEVTGQVADLGARIRNLEATERALQAIMDRAAAIKDVLAVQAELTTVRGEIERLASQKAHLEEQAAVSTLEVAFRLRPDPVLVAQVQYDPQAEVEAATASLVDVLQALMTAGIWLAVVWLPVLGSLAIALGITLLVARRVRRSTGPSPLQP